MAYYNTIAESNNFIVLDDYEKYSVLNEPSVVYQTEASLEHEFIQDLRNQGYEYLPDLNTPETLLANVRTQLQALNDVEFTDSEWAFKIFFKTFIISVFRQAKHNEIVVTSIVS